MRKRLRWGGGGMAMWSVPSCRNPRSRLRSRFPARSLPKCRPFTWWLTTTVWAGPNMRRLLIICAALCLPGISMAGLAQDLRVPAPVTAGDDATIATSGSAGSGKATFYLLGPGVSRKNDVNLGEEIHLQGQDLRNAGDYLALVCSDICRSGTFYVIAAKPASLSFLVHPSRVPVGRSDALSGAAFPFDQFRNLVLAPTTVTFQLTAWAQALISRPVLAQNGIAP